MPYRPVPVPYGFSTFHLSIQTLDVHQTSFELDITR
jgi:hypothetical protein